MSGLRLLMMLCAYSTMFCPILPHLGPIANWPAGLFYHFVPPLRPAYESREEGLAGTPPKMAGLAVVVRAKKQLLKRAVQQPRIPPWSNAPTKNRGLESYEESHEEAYEEAYAEAYEEACEEDHEEALE